ncbi:SLATT domain-containing protein [Streptomyces pini]
MSQPEMRPGTGGGTGGGTGRGEHGDLLGRPFPLGDWGEPAERLDELYRWVENGALEVVEWYLADRARKRRWARSLRAGTATGLAAGGVLPLLELAGGVRGAALWAFPALLLAAVCAGCDRWFGLTSGWMRGIATAQAVQRRLEMLQYDWASESVREVLGPTEGTASEAAERCLGVLRRFSEDVTELVRGETAAWMVEFRSGPAPLHTQSLTSSAWSARTAQAAAQPSRFSMPPGVRPSMPRQRPPEGPR